jgi:drug/metabolite transporter (DMT)-like permease
MAGALIVMAGRNVPTSLFGDALALASAVFFAGYLIASTRLRARLGVVEVMLWTAGTGAVLLFVAAIARARPLCQQALEGGQFSSR